ncbi:sterol 3-beta-glucosyltransferase UGT80A2-like [Olea europaea subsp. europaea]|uniref:Sterol 3-beta-glucosyltransferase UGT80A2-like n=1 Tax=Olea europaea subsp. europaea TaxID=158383 RepID=A0A8S0PJH3_OLEEU|nr:sterol 3-beta-glucosyltransferase UGT80A2-like [Olea europaea subsp. europaea]
MDKRQSAPMKTDEASSSSDSQELKSSNVVDSDGVGGGGDAAPISSLGSKISGSGGGNFSRVNTTPPKILSSDILEPVPSEFNLERSITEGQRHNVILAEDAAQIFDEKITDHQKVRILTCFHF